MRDASPDWRIYQRKRIDGVVPVVSYGLRNRLGNNRRCGKMHDRIDALLGDQPRHKFGMPDVANDQRRLLRHGLAETRRQIVQHDHALLLIKEPVHDMATDVARSACNQNRHLSNVPATNRLISKLPAQPLPTYRAELIETSAAFVA